MPGEAGAKKKVGKTLISMSCIEGNRHTNKHKSVLFPEKQNIMGSAAQNTIITTSLKHYNWYIVSHFASRQLKYVGSASKLSDICVQPSLLLNVSGKSLTNWQKAQIIKLIVILN